MRLQLREGIEKKKTNLNPYTCTGTRNSACNLHKNENLRKRFVPWQQQHNSLAALFAKHLECIPLHKYVSISFWYLLHFTNRHTFTKAIDGGLVGGWPRWDAKVYTAAVSIGCIALQEGTLPSCACWLPSSSSNSAGCRWYRSQYLFEDRWTFIFAQAGEMLSFHWATNKSVSISQTMRCLVFGWMTCDCSV